MTTLFRVFIAGVGSGGFLGWTVHAKFVRGIFNKNK